MEKFDVVVIGSGPGGYVSAIRCAQLGLSTAIIEKYNTLGGTCLNVGCIPSKALLDSSEHFKTALHDFEKHGIDISTPKVNLPKMMARKEEVISQTCDGVQYLMDKNKIKAENIAKKRIKVGLILNEFGEQNKIKVTEQEVQAEVQKQLRMMPGQEKMVMEFYQKNPSALASLRGTVYEEKIIDVIKTKAKPSKKEISKEEAEKILKEHQKQDLNHEHDHDHDHKK